MGISTLVSWFLVQHPNYYTTLALACPCGSVLTDYYPKFISTVGATLTGLPSSYRLERLKYCNETQHAKSTVVVNVNYVCLKNPVKQISSKHSNELTWT